MRNTAQGTPEPRTSRGSGRGEEEGGIYHNARLLYGYPHGGLYDVFCRSGRGGRRK